MQSSEQSKYSSPKGNNYIVKNYALNENGNQTAEGDIKGRRILTENNVTFNTLESENSRRFPQQMHFVKKGSQQKPQYRVQSETIGYEELQRDYSKSNMQKDYSNQNINLMSTNINLQNKCYNLISPKNITIQNVKIQNNRKIDLQNLKNQIDKGYQSLPSKKQQNTLKKKGKTFNEETQKMMKSRKQKKQKSEDTKLKNMKSMKKQYNNSSKVVNTEMSDNMKKLVNKSLNKNKIIKEEQKNEQKCRQAEESQKKIDKEIFNQETRKRNIDRFRPKTENTHFKKFPWNFN